MGLHSLPAKEPLTILLTGSVFQNYPLLDKTGLQDPMERLIDYLCAIRKWMDVPEIEHVVYCDAGGFNFPKGIFDDQKFESLAFDLRQACIDHGKSYAETVSIEYAMQNSRTLGRHFFKCTGRLFVKNFQEILRWIAPMEPCFYFLKNHKISYADSRFFWMNRDLFYEAVYPFLYRINDYKGSIAEVIYYFHGQNYKSLPVPIYVGRSGQTGNIYDENFSEETKKEAHRLLLKMDIPSIMDFLDFTKKTTVQTKT